MDHFHFYSFFVSDTEISLSFPSQYSHTEVIILAIIISFMMIIVVVGNMLVIIAIATEHTLSIVQNWFIASLAFADLSLGLIIMPFSLAYEVIVSSFMQQVHKQPTKNCF